MMSASLKDAWLVLKSQRKAKILTAGRKVKKLYFWLLMTFLGYFCSLFSGWPSHTVLGWKSPIPQHPDQGQHLRVGTRRFKSTLLLSLWHTKIQWVQGILVNNCLACLTNVLKFISRLQVNVFLTAAAAQPSMTVDTGRVITYRRRVQSDLAKEKSPCGNNWIVSLSYTGINWCE